MTAFQASSKPRIQLAALVLTTLFFVLLLRSEYVSSHTWKAIPTERLRQLPGSTYVMGDAKSGGQELDGEDLLFDHSPAPGTGSKDSSSITHVAPAGNGTSGTTALGKPRRKNAIVSAIWNYNYASMALMLGHSIKEHNDLDALDADLILLTLEWEEEWSTGLTSWNKTILAEKGGWEVRETKRITPAGVDLRKIQKHRQLNLNKLQIFSWEEYDRLLFIDADCIVKGSVAELFALPKEVEFAAAPDSWPGIERDSKINSGVMLFTPKTETFSDMMEKLADKAYHDPTEGDQQFLQNYWKYRDWRMPMKFNLNLVNWGSRKKSYERIAQDVRIIHFTTRKPSEKWKGWGHCGKGCGEQPLRDYKESFIKMRQEYGLEEEIGVLG